MRCPLVNMDLFMLALRAAGIDAPDDRIIDGRDPLPVLRDGASSPHRNIYFRYRDISGLRQGRWKLVRQSPTAALELYDLQTDFAESRDLAADRTALAQRLWDEFSDWLANARQGH